MTDAARDEGSLATDAQALVGALRSFAGGDAAPPGLFMEHYATSAHVTTLTIASAEGFVEVRDVMRKRPLCRGRARVEDLRAAAAALVASGFPNIRAVRAKPVGPPATAAPVRLTVRQDARVASAELPASRVGEVRAFAQAVVAVARLGDGARRVKPLTHEALFAMATGGSSGGLWIEVQRVDDEGRSFSIELTAQGMIVQTDHRGARRRRSALGPATAGERVALARALLDGGYPEAHGAARVVEGPRYVVRVGVEEGLVEVTFEADALASHEAANKVVQTLYAAAARIRAETSSA